MSATSPQTPMQANLPGIPAQITREYIQSIMAKYNALKARGASENDPEYLHTRKILSLLRQKQEESARRQAALRQQQQEAQTPTQQEPLSAITNGIQSPAPQNLESPVTAESQGLTNMTKEQAQMLRSQIKAFNMLQKDLPIPTEIQEQLFKKEELNTAVEEEKDDDRPPYLYYQNPHSLLRQMIPYNKHRSRKERTFIPSIMPLGIDPHKARDERNTILYTRLISRKQELENLPANIASWNTATSDIPIDDGHLKLKALIEYKMLTLLPKQRAMREAIGREMMQTDTLAMTANRALYRRTKKVSARESRMTEKLERAQRHEHESKKKTQETEFLNSIRSHHAAIKGETQERYNRIHRLGRIMQQTHQQIERDEQKRIERTAKQRLQALKANDEETYLKLLGQAKDSRITHLLKQTDGFLGQLAASVKEQQRGAVRRYAQEEEQEPEEAEEGSDDEEGGKKVDYYEVAHRIKEPVVAQSTNLVGGTLKEYQLKGLQWMLSLYNNNLNGILADEMGLGKTIQTISLVTYLIEKKRQPGPYLVIVPLSTLTNWTNEFEKWAPSVKKIVYKGTPPQRKVLQNQIRYGEFQVLLTTYEFIIKDRPVLAKIRWLHMIVDEGHRMKNANSKLSGTISQYYHTRFRLILTGTPLQNNLPELWALLNFVLPTIFKSVKSFDEWFNTPFANTGGQDKMELTEEEQLLVIRRLHKVLRPFLLRRLKKDVEKDLPDKQEHVIKCGFSALQMKLYKQLVNNQRLTVSDGKGGKTSMKGLSNMLMQLRKLCNHPFVFEEVEDQINPTRGTNDLLWRTAGKFELLDRVLPKFQATKHRVLMFFQMTQIMNIMEDFMRLRGIEYLRLDGSTKADDRSELLKEFNAPNSKYFCFLLSTRAGGLGLNLQTADTVIIYDSDWNPHQDLQAQDRAHRIGQKNEVRILRLISSNSVEEKILERAQFKLDMDGKVIQAGKFDNKSTNEERDEMLRVMLETAEAAEELETDEMDDEELNMAMKRNDDEFELFQKMDIEREKTQAYGPGRAHPRLFSEEELPEIYINDDVPIVEEDSGPLGRGARERTKIRYDDGLTEEQWLDAVDADDDTIEDAIARKQNRIAKRQATKDRRLTGGIEDEEEEGTPTMSRASSEEQLTVVNQNNPKKRGRKPKIEKRKADEMLDAAQPPKKRGRQAKVPETLSTESRNALQKILTAVVDDIEKLKDTSPEAGATGRLIIGPFVLLPPKSDYPDYYQLIRQPICIDQIAKKITKRQYQSTKEFVADIDLLCSNCRQYNEDGSMLFRDANTIQATCHNKIAEHMREFPNYQDGVASSNGQGNGMNLIGGESATPSGTGTPRIALKLGKRRIAGDSDEE